ncbi:hypothetical protein K402DRAFT_11300 [Aulographum hederae CBS 113979]|uniref:Uncharacterized protein n=1 Tax=Aulographum hederae CBS 113979 TaxID=1176131 RepID=A0A6G1HHY3_9PEZI|nr:hypothetical protein K402DRAFT_11300 [Aulographum hederae CBS 113979]
MAPKRKLPLLKVDSRLVVKEPPFASPTPTTVTSPLQLQQEILVEELKRLFGFCHDHALSISISLQMHTQGPTTTTPAPSTTDPFSYMRISDGKGGHKEFYMSLAASSSQAATTEDLPDDATIVPEAPEERLIIASASHVPDAVDEAARRLDHQIIRDGLRFRQLCVRAKEAEYHEQQTSPQRHRKEHATTTVRLFDSPLDSPLPAAATDHQREQALSLSRRNLTPGGHKWYQRDSRALRLWREYGHDIRSFHLGFQIALFLSMLLLSIFRENGLGGNEGYWKWWDRLTLGMSAFDVLLLVPIAWLNHRTRRPLFEAKDRGVNGDGGNRNRDEVHPTDNHTTTAHRVFIGMGSQF